MSAKTPKQSRRKSALSGTAVVWPAGACEILGISPWTRWRLESRGLLPQRDFRLGNRSGWQRATFEAALDSMRNRDGKHSA
jgi:predicted DNA-binding transcriptional regulator AlpA